MLRVEPGARLASVWVDGQRGSVANFAVDAINVQTMGGNGTLVSDSRISNSRGWTNIQVLGTYEDAPCDDTKITDNLITAYSSGHRTLNDGGLWTDGISVGCEHGVVRGNSVVDPTDVGIVVFRSTPAVQQTLVRDNRILSAGNAAFAAIAFAGGYDQNRTSDFTGTRVMDNTLWTSDRTHFDIGISVGARPWFGYRHDPGTGRPSRAIPRHRCPPSSVRASPSAGCTTPPSRATYWM